MLPIADRFEETHAGCEVVYGRGRTEELGAYLADRGVADALVVCGSTVGANDDLLDPIRDGLGERHAGTFDETTPQKRVETAFGVLEAAAETGADALVAVGGGSSLDVARQATVLDADGRDLEDLEAAAGDGAVAPLTGEPTLPVVVVPTTFAGADISAGGSLSVLSAAASPTDQPVTVSGSAMPLAAFVDPAAFETTPRGVLARSAMNGFDKGVETVYARDASPVSDAAAIHGLRLLSEGLPVAVGDRGGDEAAAMDRAAVGAALVQMDRKVSVIHAVGHGFARRYDVQQGAVHAVVAPHVLAFLFDQVDASRRALAAGVGVDTAGRDDDAVAEAVVGAVASVRDALGVPDRLRELGPTREADLAAIAEFVAEDSPMERAPTGIDASPERIEGMLREAW